MERDSNGRFIKGYKLTEEEKQWMMQFHLGGWNHTEETKEILRLAKSGKNNPNFGKHLSEATRLKMSLSRTGEKNHFYGKHHTDEAKKKISDRVYPTGSECSTYKNGTYTDKNGYIGILSPDHPAKDKRGYVYEHRLIMEKVLERYLTSLEIIHHINGDTSDNRIENLMLFSDQAGHKKYHAQFKKQKIA